MAVYAIEFAARRRLEDPKPDLTTLVLDGDFGGEAMSDVDFGSFFVQLVTAGNDTTKTMLSSGLVALLAHPTSSPAVRADPSLIPVRSRRSCAGPTRSTTSAAPPPGPWSSAAWRSPRATRWRCTTSASGTRSCSMTRSGLTCTAPNPHLSFGIAEALLPGVHLARLEGRCSSRSCWPRSDIALAGDPVRLRSNLNNSFKRVPVHLGPRH
ncbi:MAG: hypothetical protein R2746_16105 [Acidimicrobiales bacterium]